MNEIEGIYHRVGCRLRQARLNTRLSAEKTAHKAGGKGNTLIMYELGQRRMGLHQFVGLCRAVRLDPVEVLQIVLEEEHEDEEEN